jgi:hypothetical protein
MLGESIDYILLRDGEELAAIEISVSTGDCRLCLYRNLEPFGNSIVKQAEIVLYKIYILLLLRCFLPECWKT